jgi:ketosteroid isomerase-like protein
MKRSSIVLMLLGSAVAMFWLSLSPQPVVADDFRSKNVERVIAKLERNWAAAIVNKDTEALERLLAPEFNGTTPTGITYTREMAIADLKSGVYVVDEMYFDEIAVNVYGNTAVAFIRQQEKSKYGTENFSGVYYYTDVWVKRNGRWQVVASHGSPSNAFPPDEDITLDDDC